MSKSDKSMPPLVSALPVLVGLIAAIIAITAGPSSTGASLCILVCAVASLFVKVHPNTGNYAIVGGIIVAGGLVGWLIGESSGLRTVTSPESEPNKTGFINGKWREQEARGAVETLRVPGEGSSRM